MAAVSSSSSSSSSSSDRASDNAGGCISPPPLTFLRRLRRRLLLLCRDIGYHRCRRLIVFAAARIRPIFLMSHSSSLASSPNCAGATAAPSASAPTSALACVLLSIILAASVLLGAASEKEYVRDVSLIMETVRSVDRSVPAVTPTTSTTTTTTSSFDLSLSSRQRDGRGDGMSVGGEQGQGQEQKERIGRKKNKARQRRAGGGDEANGGNAAGDAAGRRRRRRGGAGGNRGQVVNGLKKVITENNTTAGAALPKKDQKKNRTGEVQKNIVHGPDAPPGSILPNVLLVGAQKSGTTALAQWLFRNESVCNPRRFPGEPSHYSKEAQFFDNPSRFALGTRFWASRFEHCGGGNGDGGGGAHDQNFGYNRTKSNGLVMDASPNYLPKADIVRATYDRIGAEAKDGLRIMLILRDPSSRELSLYNHKANMYRTGTVEPGMERFVKNVLRGNGNDKNKNKNKADGGAYGNDDDNKNNSNIDGGKHNTDETILSFAEYAKRTVLRRFRKGGPCNVEGNEWNANVHRIQCYGLYARHLERWMGAFRHDQILVLTHEELVERPEVLMGRVRSFLGLEKGVTRGVGEGGAMKGDTESGGGGDSERKGEGNRLIQLENTRSDAFKVQLMPCDIRDRLVDVFRTPNEELYRLLSTKSSPDMEQRPFPKFKPAECSATAQRS